ncbi:hypothetical protein BDY17DRAFT_109950 [Neohortaea acidophila]|uniref:NTF2-like domain-containing protein n=1 Tax=Neohortaea acidophila TaxID=245834 RepID=A0A6A6Q111_9PEZI|nr:uncharacterized protein BDY17DRAFT_109950 [Neohortaea acidophila]KAF2485676.1 hypothetical protein BDY17DRAFT_109950 [Neohortaea acidophila]
MRGLIVSTLSLLALGGVEAHPQSYGGSSSSCMPYDTGVALATAFRDLIALPFNQTLAKHAMTPTFTDYSDSVIELINNGCPNGPIALGSPTFSGRTAFIKGQSGQAPIPFTIQKTYPACDSVAFTWVSQPGPGGPANGGKGVQPEQQVSGIIILETVPNTWNPSGEFDWKIQTAYSEFNSGAWLYDLGVFVPTNCSAPTTNSTS